MDASKKVRTTEGNQNDRDRIICRVEVRGQIFRREPMDIAL